MRIAGPTHAFAAQLDRVHIHEHLALAETISQAVRQPTSKMFAVFPTVANENATALGSAAKARHPGSTA